MESKKVMKKRHLKVEALSLIRKNEIDSAIEKYTHYLNLNPEDSEAWAGLGGAYRRKGLLDDAINNYQKAYQINPDSSYALINLITLMTARNKKGDQDKIKKYLPIALLLIKKILNSDKADFWTWYDLATLYLINGDIENAKSSFNYAAELTPKTAKENYKSVLDNLEFLRNHNPNLKGVKDIIDFLSQYL